MGPGDQASFISRSTTPRSFSTRNHRMRLPPVLASFFHPLFPSCVLTFRRETKQSTLLHLRTFGFSPSRRGDSLERFPLVEHFFGPLAPPFPLVQSLTRHLLQGYSHRLRTSPAKSPLDCNCYDPTEAFSRLGGFARRAVGLPSDCFGATFFPPVPPPISTHCWTFSTILSLPVPGFFRAPQRRHIVITVVSLIYEREISAGDLPCQYYYPFYV